MISVCICCSLVDLCLMPVSRRSINVYHASLDLYPDYNRAGGHAMIVCRRRTEQATALAVSGLQGQYLVEKEMMNEQAAALRHRVQELLGECRVRVCQGLSVRICDTASINWV